MSLLDVAKKIKAEGFDPRKDSVNGNDGLPEGTYSVVLKNAAAHVSNKGWESVGYTFEVRGGDYSGRTEFASFGTLSEWNGKDLSRMTGTTVKFFQKALVLAGDQAKTSDFTDCHTLAEALKRKAVGSYYELTIKDNEWQGRTFRNYELDEPTTGQEVFEITDDDLPF